ncbi:MAG: HAD-IIB family hydrolase [Bacillota bacterium]
MKKPYIVFFDVDNTVYDPVKREVPASTVDALSKLKAREDTLVAIATGRAFYMLDIIDPIKDYVDIYVTINGQLIYEHGHTIHDEAMPKEDIALFEKRFKAHGFNFGYIGKETQAIHTLDDYAKHMFDTQSLPRPKEDQHFPRHSAVYQMWAFADEETTRTFDSHHPEYEVVPWNHDGFDLVHLDRHKGGGVLRVLEYYGIPLENAWGFGDGNNDLPMFQALKNTVAMDNAEGALKAIAHMVTSACDDDGIARALRRLKFIK